MGTGQVAGLILESRVKSGFDLKISAGDRLGPVPSFAVAGWVWVSKI